VRGGSADPPHAAGRSGAGLPALGRRRRLWREGQRQMTARPAVPPAWRLERRGLEDAELRLSGDWIARETGLRDAAAVRQVLTMAGGAARLRLETGGLGRWDSALVAFLQALRRAATE